MEMERNTMKTISGSRSRDRDSSRDRDRSSRDRDRDRSERVRPKEEPMSADVKPDVKPHIPALSSIVNPLAGVTAVLPPRVRASLVQQSILAKPEALTSVLQDVEEQAGVDLTVAIPADLARQQERERKRKSRWSTTKSFVPGMPTVLPPGLDDNQQRCYLRKLHFSLFGQRERVVCDF